MLVAASTECFPDLSLHEALQRLVDLEYTNVEIDIHAGGKHLHPQDVVRDAEKCIALCRDTHRLNVIAYSVDIDAEGDEYYRQFAAVCSLAKSTKVVTLTVPSAELGTPFNEEVERLRRLVALAQREGARVAMRSQTGCLSGDPDTVTVLCDNVDGLGLTLDPSHYVLGGPKRNVDKLYKYTYHVHLRDTTKDQLQVRIGQGEIEYGRLITLLNQQRYDRALSVHVTPMEGVDHPAELRKMRLLLESLV